MKDDYLRRAKYADRDWMTRHYLDLRLSLRQIASKANCSLRTAARWLRRHGIPARSSREGITLKDRSGKNNANWKGRSVCPECGGKKDRAANRCTSCYYLRLRGRGNPNWKGLADVTVLVRQWIRDHWRPAIFKRDGYRCRKCDDATGRNLNAHHVERVECIIGEIAAGQKTDTAEARFDLYRLIISHPKIRSLSNGVTLCGDCHAGIHKGKRERMVMLNER